MPNLLNAILEDSYIRLHAHYESSGVETLVILEGAAMWSSLTILAPWCL